MVSLNIGTWFWMWFNNFDCTFKGAICSFSSKMNPFLLPVCKGVAITHYNDPLVGFCYYLWRPCDVPVSPSLLCVRVLHLYCLQVTGWLWRDWEHRCTLCTLFPTKAVGLLLARGFWYGAAMRFLALRVDTNSC